MSGPGDLRLGIDLGGTKIAGALLAGGDVLSQDIVPTPQGDYAATLNAIADLVSTLRQAGAVVDGVEIPVGVGSPGSLIANPLADGTLADGTLADGIMANCNSQCLNGQPLLRDLEQLLPGPVRLANDADCFALSEYVLQVQSPTALHSKSGKAARGVTPISQMLFGVILGTGVGGGFVHHGQLLQGPNRLSGEWGHTPLPYFRCDENLSKDLFALELELKPRRCYCGRENCLELFLSGPGLRQTAQESGHWQLQTLSPEQLVALALSSSGSAKPALQVLTLYLHMLGRSLAQVINVVDPSVIVLGGGLSNVQWLYQNLATTVAPYLFSRQSCVTPIVAPQGGAASGVFGAAALWL